MAVRGVGTDLVRVARVRQLMAKHPARFIGRILTDEERAADRPITAATLAKRWAAKEAVAKALGTGIGATYGFHDIVLTHDAAGAPVVRVAGVQGRIWLSVADDGPYATATAVWDV